MNIEILLSRLEKVKPHGNGKYLACCPAHNDKSPSLAIREIEAELHIPRSSLHRRALAEGWKKGFLMPLVHEMVRIEMLLRSLTPTQRKAVEAEVKRLLKLKEFDQAHSNPWLKRLMK